MRWLVLIALLVGGLILVLSRDGETIGGFDASTFAALLMSGAMLVFIGAAAIAGYGGRVGPMIRDLAIWAAIALALVTGYTYRGELTQIANRITGELLPPGEVQVVDARGPGERSVRVRKRADGHFAARAQLNGVAVNLMVDTGASTVVLRAADARQIGIDVDRLQYSVPVQTANGQAYAAPVRLRSIYIGPIVVEGVDALIAKPGALKESLLGMSFLRRLRSYEFSGDFLTMRG